jgi:hypothetical protein
MKIPVLVLGHGRPQSPAQCLEILKIRLAKPTYYQLP